MLTVITEQQITPCELKGKYFILFLQEMDNFLHLVCLFVNFFEENISGSINSG